MTVFDYILPLMRTAVREHLRRGSERAFRVLDVVPDYEVVDGE